MDDFLSIDSDGFLIISDDRYLYNDCCCFVSGVCCGDGNLYYQYLDFEKDSIIHINGVNSWEGFSYSVPNPVDGLQDPPYDNSGILSFEYFLQASVYSGGTNLSITTLTGIISSLNEPIGKPDLFVTFPYDNYYSLYNFLGDGYDGDNAPTAFDCSVVLPDSSNELIVGGYGTSHVAGQTNIDGVDYFFGVTYTLGINVANFRSQRVWPTGHSTLSRWPSLSLFFLEYGFFLDDRSVFTNDFRFLTQSAIVGGLDVFVTGYPGWFYIASGLDLYQQYATELYPTNYTGTDPFTSLPKTTYLDAGSVYSGLPFGLNIVASSFTTRWATTGDLSYNVYTATHYDDYFLTPKLTGYILNENFSQSNEWHFYYELESSGTLSSSKTKVELIFSGVFKYPTITLCPEHSGIYVLDMPIAKPSCCPNTGYIASGYCYPSTLYDSYVKNEYTPSCTIGLYTTTGSNSFIVYDTYTQSDGSIINIETYSTGTDVCQYVMSGQQIVSGSHPSGYTYEFTHYAYCAIPWEDTGNLPFGISYANHPQTAWLNPNERGPAGQFFAYKTDFVVTTGLTVYSGTVEKIGFRYPSIGHGLSSNPYPFAEYEPDSTKGPLFITIFMTGTSNLSYTGLPNYDIRNQPITYITGNRLDTISHRVQQGCEIDIFSDEFDRKSRFNMLDSSGHILISQVHNLVVSGFGQCKYTSGIQLPIDLESNSTCCGGSQDGYCYPSLNQDIFYYAVGDCNFTYGDPTTTASNSLTTDYTKNAASGTVCADSYTDFDTTSNSSLGIGSRSYIFNQDQRGEIPLTSSTASTVDALIASDYTLLYSSTGGALTMSSYVGEIYNELAPAFFIDNPNFSFTILDFRFIVVGKEGAPKVFLYANSGYLSLNPIAYVNVIPGSLTSSFSKCNGNFDATNYRIAITFNNGEICLIELALAGIFSGLAVC